MCVIRVRKNWFVGTTDTVPENDMQQQQRFIFYFYTQEASDQQAVCVGRGEGEAWSKAFVFSMTPSRGNTVPYLPKIYGKPCTWWQGFSL